MADLWFLSLLTMIAAGLGVRVLGAFGERPEHPADAWGLAVALGLGMIALAGLALGSLGVLTRDAVVGLELLGLLVGWVPGWRASFDAIVSVARGPGREEERRSLWFARVVDLGLVATLVGTLLTALAPVTDGDALCYHLQVPKVFLHAQATTFEPDLHETIYPLATEMLYAGALAIRGPVACRLVQWLFGVVFALIVMALARPSLGDRRARWAGVTALVVPAVSNGMSAPLNDVALAAMGNAAILGWVRWHARPSIRSAGLAGILLGLAVGVKYPALVLGGLLTSSFGVLGPKGIPLGRRVGHALVFGLVALAVGGAWYLRAYLATGNPVFPFYRQVFGGAGIDEVLDPIKRPMAATLVNVLTAVGPMTLQPDRFDSFSHQFGPVFLLFLPPLLWMRPPRTVWPVVAIGYAFLTLCVTQRQSMRFVLIAVGPMSVGVAWLASTWADRLKQSWSARGLILLLAGCLIFEATLALARSRHGLRVVLGVESAESYLSRREPTYPVGRWIDANLPPNARIIGQDHRGFYLPRPYSMELAHRRRTGLGTHGESAEAIVDRLRSEGFTHLLLCPPEPETAVEFDPTLGRLLEAWLDRRNPIYRERLTDGDGVVRRYEIYALGSGEKRR